MLQLPAMGDELYYVLKFPGLFGLLVRVLNRTCSEASVVAENRQRLAPLQQSVLGHRMAFDDSTGKAKYDATRRRGTAVSFVVGLLLGVLASCLYLKQQQGAFGVHRELVSLQQQGEQGARKPDSAQSSVQAVDTSTQATTNTAAAEAAYPELLAVLRKVAPDKELLAAVSNKNYLWGNPPMIKTFTDGIKRAGITNHLILALDSETKKWCDDNGINAYLQKLQLHKAQQGTGENHAVSAMKFGILKPFMELGYSVLLSDVDIAILKNPFEHLHRDSDVEGMTDGFDDHTAYGSIEGFDDPSMGWARYAQYYKHFNLNSGLFYLKASERTVSLMTRLDDRLRKVAYWDQTAYNEEIFFLSHGTYKSPQVTVRVMEIDKFMNSKRLFKIVRHQPYDNQPRPIMVHVNYHPDKHERMLAVFKYYDGDKDALKSFPGGSEPGQ